MNYNLYREFELRKRRDSYKFEERQVPQPAKIFSLNGSVFVPGLPNFVWVHQFGLDESPMAVRRGDTAVAEGLWVWIAPSPKVPYQWEILDVYRGDMAWGNYTYLNRTGVVEHAPNHEWPQEGNPGNDPYHLYMPAIYPLKSTGDGSSLIVTVNGFIWGDGNRFAGGTIDLTSYVPSSNSIPVLVYFDTKSETLEAISGTYTSGGDIYTAATYEFPTVPETAIASSFVILSSGQTTITTADDIYDARAMFNLTHGIPHPIRLYDGSSLTISFGQITVVEDYHSVESESGSEDDLDTIVAEKEHQILMLEAASGHLIHVLHDSGNIKLSGESDYELVGDKKLLLFWDGTTWFGFTAGGSSSITTSGGSFILYSQTSDQQVINTTTPTTLLSSGQGSKIIGGGELKEGTHIVIEGAGYIATNASPTITLSSELNGTEVISSGAIIADSDITDVGFEFKIDITFRAVGTSGQVIAVGKLSYNNGTSYNIINSTPTSINTDVDLTIDALLAWGTASNSNYLTIQSAKIIVQTPPTEISEDTLLLETRDDLLQENGDYILL